jgi:hypothetical protein
MKWNRRTEKSHVSQALLALLVLGGAFLLVRELPALRRYLRIERM